MRTLFITANNLPHARVSGGQAATLSALELYAGLGPVHLVALVEGTEPPGDLGLLRSLCQQVVLVPTRLLFARHRLHHLALAARAAAQRTSFKLLKFRTPAFVQALCDAARGGVWDVIHFDGLVTAQFGPLLPPGRRVLLEHNVEWEIFDRHAAHQRLLPARWFGALEARRLRQAEIRLCSSVDLVLTLSDRDGDILARAGCQTPIRTLRLPVAVVAPPRPFEQTTPTVVSLGNLTNVGREQGTLWFARAVWPRLRRRVPWARWRIVGGNPTPAVRALHGRDGVEVLGFVPDLDVVLHDVRACVVPLHIGGGIRVKLLDMFARGVPCISTSIGAQGLEVASGRELLLADEPAAFAEAVAQVLQDAETYTRLALAGQHYLAARHQWAACEAAFTHALAAAGVRGVGDGRAANE